ncbi:MAG: 4-hydroxy-2-oxovalerate aldolase [uncultured marine phage]|uniref:4-hydroxy-2-oxovalerate aldolase n=1 Tax=uncultured marine phage TaxID=707152 RepID=A0A8D9CAT5_9VIRU|nr:MAG: 4-hydroxy-2-oxovalerate aldolase [uncultured marine phage]
MNIIDVTLRDGGHLMNFDWDVEFAKEYYTLLSTLEDVNYIELGYWKQTEKSLNRFYGLNFDEVLNLTGGKGLNNVSIMIDYHYCLKDVTEYPRDDQNEIAMIRLCSRKEDIDEALKFGEELKAYTNLNVSFNIFNASNYTKEELDSISEKVAKSSLNYIYFADTHGTMDMETDFDKFTYMIEVLKKNDKKVGFHLHDHNGKGYFNYRTLLKTNIDSMDTSVKGMGKGSGNLRLEYVISKDNLMPLTELIHKYSDLFITNPSAYELITSKYGMTDNYAKDGIKKNMSISDFDKYCSLIKGLDKDSYNPNIINTWK